MDNNKQQKEIIRGSLKIVWAYHAETADPANIDGLRFSFWEVAPALTKRRKEGNEPQWRCIEPNNPKLRQQVYPLALTHEVFQQCLTQLQARLDGAERTIQYLEGHEKTLIQTQIQRLPIQIELVEDMYKQAKFDYPALFPEQP